MKLLIKFPSRERPDKFFCALDKYIDFANNLKQTAFLLSFDSNDPTMNNDAVKARLEQYRAKGVKLVYFYGNSKTKIEAINADIHKVADWDIVLLASDDMIPVTKGYDDVIRSDMNEFFKDRDGVLWYNDGGQNNINTLCILGFNYFKRFNYIYHPDYVSLWCDNEFTDVSVALKRAYKSDTVLIEHAHPVYKKCNYDQLYARNESFYQIDKATYEKRKQANFDLNFNRPTLSILTPSVPERVQTHLTKLINKINSQILNKSVEHLIFLDNKKRSIGLKREALVQMATGKYLAFVDDDDDISADYIDSLLKASETNADVITFKQNCFVNNNPVSVINFSLHNSKNEGYEPGKTINRMPFHVCAWKSSIAKNYGFIDKNYSEDWFWAQQLIKAAKTEHHIDKVLHTYVYSDTVTTTPLILK